ncbi:MAG TPA: nitroreductase family protein [Gemmataceae bacterium]|nr:nitroreductase family protein [Gemmataceae bacterium]
MIKAASNDYPIHDLLKRRWSPRAFADRLVEPEKLRSLLEAARWAPSSFNEQPWIFLIGTRDRPEEYERVLGCLVEFNQAWAKAAPVLLLTCAHLTFDRNGQPNRHAFHDVGLAMANLTMQATAEGLAVHQMAGIVPERVRAAFGVPDGWDPVAAAAVGYAGDPNTLSDELRRREEAPSTRKPLTSFVFSGGWGKPSSLLPGQS